MKPADGEKAKMPLNWIPFYETPKQTGDKVRASSSDKTLDFEKSNSALDSGA